MPPPSSSTTTSMGISKLLKLLPPSSSPSSMGIGTGAPHGLRVVDAAGAQ